MEEPPELTDFVASASAYAASGLNLGIQIVMYTERKTQANATMLATQGNSDEQHLTRMRHVNTEATTAGSNRALQTHGYAPLHSANKSILQ